MALCALSLFALLAIAAKLNPHPDGIGTHQQLGLPPCTFWSLTGLPCPSCGMTTSWAHFVRGQWIAAWRSNSGGMVLAFTTAAAAPWLLASAARGKWWAKVPSEWTILMLCFFILAVTMIHWLIRIWPHAWRG